MVLEACGASAVGLNCGVGPVEALPLLIDEPRLRSLRPEEVVIENLTTGERARAVRLLPDGGFDGFVPLAAGENMLQIEAVLADGLRASDRLSVHYERPVPETETDRRNAARLLVELRRRTEAIDGD